MAPRSVTITDVAKRAGVSISTVSRVLNRSMPVSEDLHTRVMAAVQELDYKPSLLAQNLRSSTITSPMIGVIVTDLRPPFFSEAITALQEVFTDNNRMVYICNANSDPELELLYAEHLQRLHVEGVVFVSTWGWEDLDPIRHLHSNNIPVAVINRKVNDLPVDVVYVDKTKANYLATSHLLNLGHRQIACISILSLGAVNLEEVQGYRQAIQEAGLPVREDMIIAAYPSYSGAYEAAKSLLTRRDRPTAIFARSDSLAVGAIRAAIDLGLRVPEDVSVIGFGDVDIAPFLNPPLTTIRQPIQELGVTAASMLLERIANQGKSQRQAILEPRLILRGSTTTPAQQTMPANENGF